MNCTAIRLRTTGSSGQYVPWNPLVDDIQFIAGTRNNRGRVLQHSIVCTRWANRSVICSDRLHRRIVSLEERLRSSSNGDWLPEFSHQTWRPGWPFCASQQTRLNIVYRTNSLAYIAVRVTKATSRELDGCLNRPHGLHRSCTGQTHTRCRHEPAHVLR